MTAIMVASPPGLGLRCPPRLRGLIQEYVQVVPLDDLFGPPHVPGRLRQRSLKTHDGDKQTVIEIDVDKMGPSLRYAVVKPKALATKQRHDSHTAEDEPPL
jgi:hypothetical protein